MGNASLRYSGEGLRQKLRSHVLDINKLIDPTTAQKWLEYLPAVLAAREDSGKDD